MIVQCKCECGTQFEEYDNRGRKRQYIKGHQRRGKHHSPEARQLISIGNTGKIVSPETKRKLSEKNKGKTHSEEARRNMSINHADFKGENNPMFGKTPSDATRQLQSDVHKGMKHSPEAKRNMSINHPNQDGSNNPNWRGGITNDPYCFEFDAWLKEEIKERDDFQCKNPDCGSINLLGIHHIDYDKKNCSTDNLITLCRSCNSKANSNREHWQEFYSNIMTNRLTNCLTNNN